MACTEGPFDVKDVYCMHPHVGGGVPVPQVVLVVRPFTSVPNEPCLHGVDAVGVTQQHGGKLVDVRVDPLKMERPAANRALTRVSRQTYEHNHNHSKGKACMMHGATQRGRPA